MTPVSRLVADLLRRGRRLRRGDAPALGQLGGRRRDPRRRHRAVRRPRQAALHRLRGPVVQRPGTLDHAPPPAGPAAGDRPGPRDGALPAGRPSRRRGVRHPPRPATASGRIVAEIRAEEAAVGRTADPLRVFADLVVFLDDEPGRRRRRKAPPRRARRPRATAPTPSCSPGRPAELADLPGRLAASTGIAGFRLRPGAQPHDLEAITRRLVPAAAAAGPLPAPTTRRPPCGPGSGWPDRPTATPAERT